MNCGFGNTHGRRQFSLCSPLPQRDVLDTLLNKLWQILRGSPGIFFSDTNLGELIMPPARVHAARCHSLQIVVHATLNLLEMSTMAHPSRNDRQYT